MKRAEVKMMELWWKMFSFMWKKSIHQYYHLYNGTNQNLPMKLLGKERMIFYHGWWSNNKSSTTIFGIRRGEGERERKWDSKGSKILMWNCSIKRDFIKKMCLLEVTLTRQRKSSISRKTGKVLLRKYFLASMIYLL